MVESTKLMMGLKAMMAKGKVFKTGNVDEWMDCGNKNVTVKQIQNAGFRKKRQH
jgi:glucose-1-phosphate thymidylyltransferase